MPGDLTRSDDTRRPRIRRTSVAPAVEAGARGGLSGAVVVMVVGEPPPDGLGADVCVVLVVVVVVVVVEPPPPPPPPPPEDGATGVTGFEALEAGPVPAPFVAV